MRTVATECSLVLAGPASECWCPCKSSFVYAALSRRAVGLSGIVAVVVPPSRSARRSKKKSGSELASPISFGVATTPTLFVTELFSGSFSHGLFGLGGQIIFERAHRESRPRGQLQHSATREKSQIARALLRICCDLFFEAALILLQKSSFSLNDSHAFNRANNAHRQHWQPDAVTRWNFCKKASRTSLHLLRLHIAFIFVLCPSVSPAGNATVGH
jgi:hypothetical protein